MKLQHVAPVGQTGACVDWDCKPRVPGPSPAAVTAARALRPLRIRELIRVFIELRLASPGTEVVSIPGVLRNAGSPARFYMHSADRVGLRCD